MSGEMDDDGNEITCVSHDILALILSIHREWISLYIENGSVYTSKMDQSKARTTYTILTQRATTPYCKGRAIDREAHGNNNV